LLNALDQKPAPKPSSSIVSALVLGALIFPLIAGVGYLLSMSTESEAPRPKGLLSLPPPTKTPSAYVPSAPIKNDADVEPVVEFEAGEKGEGLHFTNRGTILNNYTDSSYLKVLGDIENKGNKEFSSIKLQIQLLDASGTVIEVIVSEALSNQVVLRPKDTKGFYTIKKTSPTITKLKISVQTSATQPAPSTYGEAPRVEAQWAFAKPSHLNLSVGERSARFSQYTTKAYHEAIFEFTNQGEGALTALKIQLSYFDKDNKLLSTNESYVISPSEPSILPGQTRPHKTIREVSSKFHHYTVTVIDAQ
jgi:hypothetical protein